MTIFKGKTRDRTISDFNIPAGFIVKTWMDDDLMKVWVEDIWIKHIRAECQNLVVPQSANPWMFVYIKHSKPSYENVG